MFLLYDPKSDLKLSIEAKAILQEDDPYKMHMKGKEADYWSRKSTKHCLTSQDLFYLCCTWASSRVVMVNTSYNSG